MMICFLCGANAQEKKTNLEVYGFIMTDMGYNFNSIDPHWFDVMRPTKLPSFKNEFGTDGNFFFSVRQTRFGIKSTTNTSLGELKTDFLFDLMGFGKNIGQTTFHLINAYGELGKFLIGQTASVFMDQDVFPVTLDYWGPMTRIFNFNIQVRYTPISNDKHRLAIAIERPGATADGGDDATSIQLANVKPVFKMPNFTAHYKRRGSWGHVQVAAIAKMMQWKDVSGSTTQDLSGSAIGWGWTISTALNLGKRCTVKVQTIQGHGIESHIADAPADVVPETNLVDPAKPIKGIAQPAWGFFSFAEMRWNDWCQSTIGYSQENVTNGDLQPQNAFRKGRYAMVNVRFMPWTNIMAGLEYQFGKRENFSDGFHSVASKLQVSFKFNFSTKTGF
ncbi:DcaP family trimeric outer membrane transporter [Pollutibacter soli]|uniref:DcaP family trimeric outer membrane transporter n=1 Tax=Pollutibacter soli TaxID=3034157 RepID=UPI0030134BA0